jgi:hypothetical protein
VVRDDLEKMGILDLKVIVEMMEHLVIKDHKDLKVYIGIQTSMYL